MHFVKPMRLPRRSRATWLDERAIFFYILLNKDSWSHRLTVRTTPFHGVNGGSIPPGTTTPLSGVSRKESDAQRRYIKGPLSGPIRTKRRRRSASLHLRARSAGQGSAKTEYKNSHVKNYQSFIFIIDKVLRRSKGVRTALRTCHEFLRNESELQ